MLGWRLPGNDTIIPGVAIVLIRHSRREALLAHR